jgi:hypothetical protein
MQKIAEMESARFAIVRMKERSAESGLWYRLWMEEREEDLVLEEGMNLDPEIREARSDLQVQKIEELFHESWASTAR